MEQMTTASAAMPQQAETYRRERFYVRTDVWVYGLSANAIAVYTYLCYCATRDGVCWTRHKQMAKMCSLSVSTVKRMLKELEEKQFIRTQPQFQLLSNGLYRQTANCYQLLPIPPFRENPTPVHTQQGEGVCVNREINNNLFYTNTLIQSSSEGTAIAADADGKAGSEEEALQALIDRLELNIYPNRSFAKLVEMTIRQMYRSPSMRIEGMELPQAQIRERLHMLNTACIDRVEDILCERGEEIKNIGGYVAVCLYKAPMEQCEEAVRFRASLG